MIIMKFGGTSVADCEAINRTISIVESKLQQKPVVVVSALSKVTDSLYKIADAAKRGDAAEAQELLEALRLRHQELANCLVPSGELQQELSDTIADICSKLSEFVMAICVVGEITPRSEARIISTGEWLSSTLICYAMNHRGIKTAFVDARKMIITNSNYLKADPIVEEIELRVPQVIGQAYQGMDTVITQGFISSDIEGETTVLGRGGSDYTASLIGMAVNAEAIEIWTDVDGVKTADPRRVSETRSIDKISFEEAAEMAHFGAKVLHPLTIEPAVAKNIPVYVLNSMNARGKGTAILQNDAIADGVKSISFKEHMYLLNIFSTRMINVSGFLNKVFEIFAKNKVSVDLISTSEANISLTMDSGENLDKVVAELSEFAEVHVYDDKSQVSIIGKSVVNQRGLLRGAMASLNATNVYMISQGASFVNISFVIDRVDLDEVLKELHMYLFAD